jgi:hypothetical protein
MALKKKLSTEERVGLTQEEIKLAEQYLRKFKTAGIIKNTEALKVYELFMVGSSFSDIHHQFPQYTVGQIILTTALKGWTKDREKMMSSLKDRVQARVVRSVIEQVDFLTSMLSVVNVENLAAMHAYIQDPLNNPKPDMRITSIKEYKEILDAMQKLIMGAADTKTKASALFSVVPQHNQGQKPIKKDDDEDNFTLLAEVTKE